MKDSKVATETGRTQKELLALTGMRGLAAFGVLLAHINMSLTQNHASEKILFAQPYVDIFFILSGFVISYVYIKKAAFTFDFLYKFYTARLARIYPLYLFVLLLAMIVMFALDSFTGSISKNIYYLVNQIFLLNALPMFSLGKLWLFTSWSVSIEWWLYFLLFPILVALKRIRFKLASPIIIVLISISLTFYLSTIPEGTSVTRSWVAWIRGVAGFTLGWLIHEHYVNDTRLAKWCKKNCDLLAFLCISIMLFLPLFTQKQPWLVYMASPFLILGLCYDNSTSARFLSGKPMIFLGDVSYSIYLVHPIVLTLANLYINDYNNPDIVVVVSYTLFAIISTLLFSVLSFHFLEKPARDWIKRALKRNKSTLNVVA